MSNTLLQALLQEAGEFVEAILNRYGYTVRTLAEWERLEDARPEFVAGRPNGDDNPAHSVSARPARSFPPQSLFPKRCPDGSWSKFFRRRCKLPLGHTGPHQYEVHRRTVNT